VKAKQFAAEGEVIMAASVQTCYETLSLNCLFILTGVCKEPLGMLADLFCCSKYIISPERQDSHVTVLLHSGGLSILAFRILQSSH
jgi:hypothetical protein